MLFFDNSSVGLKINIVLLSSFFQITKYTEDKYYVIPITY